MTNRRGIVVEALMRIIIMVVLVVIVFNIGKQVAEAFFGSSNSAQSVDNIVNELNHLQKNEVRPAFLILDEGTAVIGFSKNANEFRCYGCRQVYGSAFSEKLLYYSVDKPSNKECVGNACVCACLKGFTLGSVSGSQTKINCKSFSCKTSNDDLPSKISLEDALKNRNIQIASYPYWENGFFFVRRGNAETPLNGMVPPNDISKITISIEKKQINNNVFVAACPMAPCIQ